jgi:hypothetical protein
VRGVRLAAPAAQARHGERLRGRAAQRFQEAAVASDLEGARSQAAQRGQLQESPCCRGGQGKRKAITWPNPDEPEETGRAQVG